MALNIGTFGGIRAREVCHHDMASSTRVHGGILSTGSSDWSAHLISEIAEIEVLAGHEAAFEAAVAEATLYFKASRGCRSLALNRSIEYPQRYRLIVGWDSVEHHMVDFRQSEGFKAWRALVGPYVEGQPRVEHVTPIIEGF